MLESDLTPLLLWNDSSKGHPLVAAARDEQDRLLCAAARACRAAHKANEFTAQFQGLVAALHTWLGEHRDNVDAAYLAVRERDLLFLVVQKKAPFDADLSDSLTDVDLSIANDSGFELIDLEVMAVPPLSADSLKAMLSSGTVVYDAK